MFRQNRNKSSSGISACIIIFLTPEFYCIKLFDNVTNFTVFFAFVLYSVKDGCSLANEKASQSIHNRNCIVSNTNERIPKVYGVN